MNANNVFTLNKIIKYLKERTIEGDIVLTLGAGTVTNIGPKLVDPN